MVTQFSGTSCKQYVSGSPNPNPSPSTSYQYSSAAGLKHPQPKSSDPSPPHIPQSSVLFVEQLGSKSSLLVTQLSSRSASQKYSESPEPNPSPSESYQYSSAAGIKQPQPKSSMPLPAQIPQWSIISVSAFGFEQLGSGSIPLSTQYGGKSA